MNTKSWKIGLIACPGISPPVLLLLVASPECRRDPPVAPDAPDPVFTDESFAEFLAQEILGLPDLTYVPPPEGRSSISAEEAKFALSLPVKVRHSRPHFKSRAYYYGQIDFPKRRPPRKILPTRAIRPVRFSHRPYIRHI